MEIKKGQDQADSDSNYRRSLDLDEYYERQAKKRVTRSTSVLVGEKTSLDLDLNLYKVQLPNRNALHSSIDSFSEKPPSLSSPQK